MVMSMLISTMTNARILRSSLQPLTLRRFSGRFMLKVWQSLHLNVTGPLESCGFPSETTG